MQFKHAWLALDLKLRALASRLVRISPHTWIIMVYCQHINKPLFMSAPRRGVLHPVILLIVGIFLVGGAFAAMNYINNNQTELETLVEESEQEYEASIGGEYPDLYLEAGLPEYPNGTIVKKREGRDLSDGVQVTWETDDSMAAAKGFFDTELGNIGFASQPNALPLNDYAYLGVYNNGSKRFSLQITLIENTTSYKVHVVYSE